MGITVERKKNRNTGLNQLPDAQIAAGWFKGVAHTDDGIDVAQIAAIQEFGTRDGRIPPRPFMRTAEANNRQKWSAEVRQGMKDIAAKKTTAANFFNNLGLAVQGDIQAEIVALTEPALAKSTVKARARRYKTKSRQGNVSNKPLIDTGLMLGAVAYKVQE